MTEEQKDKGIADIANAASMLEQVLNLFKNLNIPELGQRFADVQAKGEKLLTDVAAVYAQGKAVEPEIKQVLDDTTALMGSVGALLVDAQQQLLKK